MLKGSNWVYKMVSSSLFPSHLEISKIDLVIDLFGIDILTKEKITQCSLELTSIFWIKKKKKNTLNIYTHTYIARFRYST